MEKESDQFHACDECGEWSESMELVMVRRIETVNVGELNEVSRVSTRCVCKKCAGANYGDEKSVRSISVHSADIVNRQMPLCIESNLGHNFCVVCYESPVCQMIEEPEEPSLTVYQSMGSNGGKPFEVDQPHSEA